MDVILHIGVHRTATTTLQRVIGGSRDALGAAGIAYCGPKRTRGGLFSGILAEDDLPALPWQARRPARDHGRVAQALIRNARDGATRLIISEENIAGPLMANLVRRDLYAGAPVRLGRMADALGQSCTRVAIGIRAYDRYWASALAFGLPRGGPAPRPALCEAVTGQPLRWRDLITAAAAAFPKAEIVVWSHEAAAARPEAQLAAMLPGPLPPLKGTRDWHNAGATPQFLKAVLVDRGENPGLIAEAAGRFMPFRPAERAVLRAHYAKDLAWLRKGADGLARFIDDPATDRGATGQGRGSRDDGEYRRLA